MNNYLLTLSDSQLDYYNKNTTNPPPKVQLLWKSLLNDLEKGLVTVDELEDVVTQLSPSYKKELVSKVTSLMDPMGPEEYLLDLVDLLEK
jgi:hypothetical protein